MTKTEFLLNLQNGRRQWHQIWRGIDLFGTSSPRKPGELSLRDILYHVAWYEREMVDMLKLRVLHGSPWWDMPQEERNVHIWEEGKSVSLLQAWRFEEQAFTELLAQIQMTSDDELVDAKFFKEMPVDWKPWEVIASNTYEHYVEHFSSIY
jgi:hypothetical protein